MGSVSEWSRRDDVNGTQRSPIFGTIRCPIIGALRCPVFGTLMDSNEGVTPALTMQSQVQAQMGSRQDRVESLAELFGVPGVPNVLSTEEGVPVISIKVNESRELEGVEAAGIESNLAS